MKRLALALVATIALAGCAGPNGRLPRGVRPVANPSAVVATELAFARVAQEKGQWTAFREFAADNAVMFVPQMVLARDWLTKQANPPQAVQWEPFSVWMSCDGSLAVTKGEWHRPNGKVGYFTTAWRRQRNGDYKWELDQGDGLAEPLAKPEMIAGQVADCSAAPGADVAPPPAGVDQRIGWSADRTLQWTVQVKPDGSRDFRVRRWTGRAYEDALNSTVAAE